MEGDAFLSPLNVIPVKAGNYLTSILSKNFEAPPARCRRFKEIFENMLNRKNTALVLVDIQEKLFQAMHEKEALLTNLQKLVKGAKLLDIAIIWAEQNPKGLGPTVHALRELLPDLQPIEKCSFSCCGQQQFVKQLKKVHCEQVLVAGIEAHVCVFQTVMDLCGLGYEVQVVQDGVSSRTPENMRIGLERIKAAGVVLTSVEMALFELLKVAEGDEFRQILNIVK